MRFASVWRGGVVVTAAFGATLLTRAAFAQTCAAADCPALTESPPPAKAAGGALRVKVDAHGLPFDRSKLRASLSRELARPVVLTNNRAEADVYVELPDAGHVHVDYTNPSGVMFRHGVDLPPDGERSVQVTSWLIVNLVRDEASELLDELRARRKEQAAAEAAAEQAAADKAAADKAAADNAAADKEAAAEAAATKAAADKAAADKAAADKAARNGRTLVRDELLRDPLRSFDAALATPLAVLRDSPRRELYLQLALGYGESGALRGVGLSMGMLRVRRDLRGAALGIGGVLVGENARGMVAAAGYSQVNGYLEGVQIGAGAAVQRGPFARGVVLAGGGALASNVTGAILGAGFASATSLLGVGISGGANVIRGPSEGVLLAGGANTSETHSGLELSAGVNATRDLRGIAIAPINVHRRVKGLQIGVVNVAEDADAAIGIISIAKNGRVQPVLSIATDGSTHVAVAIKSVVGYMFTELGSGIDLNDDEFSYDGGIGGHLKLGAGFFLEPSVHYSASHRTTDASGSPDAQQLHYLAQLGFRIGSKLDLLAGGGVRHTIVGGSGAAIAPEARAGIAFF